jgi:hypothetical protein
VTKIATDLIDGGSIDQFFTLQSKCNPGLQVPADEPAARWRREEQTLVSLKLLTQSFTTTSPLAKDIKDYKPQKAADAGVTKARDSNKWFQI